MMELGMQLDNRRNWREVQVFWVILLVIRLQKATVATVATVTTAFYLEIITHFL